MQQNDLLFGRALEARRKVTGRATDWIVVRNRLESVESSNQRQITRILDVIRTTLGFRIARGLLERPVYREFFAAGLTVFDQVEGFDSNAESSQPNLLARLDVQNLIREIGLIEEADDEIGWRLRGENSTRIHQRYAIAAFRLIHKMRGYEYRYSLIAR